jgi:signal transduction histidine kinase
MTSEKEYDQLINELRHRVESQRKTIEVLMDAVEDKATEGTSPLALMSETLNLEKIVQRKTEILQRQGQELKKALDELKLTQARLLQANKLESVGRLAAGIAHEINTPVQFVGSNIDFLTEAFTDVGDLLETVKEQMIALDQGTPADQVSQAVRVRMEQMEWSYLAEEIPIAIEQSRDGVKRISSIVQAMKEFSHPSGKEMVLCDINAIIQRTITVASNEWKYWANMQTDLEPDLPNILCHSDELGQVILNILINATHALEEKMKTTGESEKGTINVSTRLDGRDVEIRITDNGCGIPPHIRENIFEPFFTTKTVGKGTGQGLAIAHDVITGKHGGTLSFDSEQEQGTVFIIRLPLDRRSSLA